MQVQPSYVDPKLKGPQVQHQEGLQAVEIFVVFFLGDMRSNVILFGCLGEGGNELTCGCSVLLV